MMMTSLRAPHVEQRLIHFHLQQTCDNLDIEDTVNLNDRNTDR